MARNYKTGLIITGDASGGIRAVRATDKELGQLNQRFEGGSRRARTFAKESGGVSRELQVLKRMAAPVGAALAGMFAARSLQNQIQFADELQKLNLRIGASTEALSQYSYVAKQSGVEFGQLTTAWQRQTRRINEAAQGTGVASKALETLNLSARELAGLAPEDQFERIAAAMQGVADEGQRVALAQKLWDSEGVRLVQIVNQGTDAIRAQREEAERLGLTISQQTAEDMAGFNDEMSRLRFASQGVTQSLLTELVPALTSGMQAANGFIGSLRSGELEGVARTLNVTAGAAAGMAAAYLSVRGALVAVTAAQWAFNTAMRANPIMLAVSAAGALAGILITTRDNMSEVERQAKQTSQEVRGLAQGFALLTEQQQINTRSRIISDMTEWRLEASKLGAEITKLGALARESGQLTKEGGAMEIITPEQLARGRQARKELAALMTQIGAGTETLEEMDTILEEIGGSGGSLPDFSDTTQSAASSSSEAAQASEQQARALESLRREHDPLRAELAKYHERQSVLNQALADGTVTQEEYGEVLRWAAEQYVRAASGAEELEKQQKSLVQQYDRHHQKAMQLRSDLAAINEMYRRGDIDGDTYARMLANVRDEMRQLALDADPFAQDMARAWEEASNRIDETFADAFAGAFDSFDDFADQLLDGFKRLLAELAYQATLRPIVVGFTSDLGGMMGIPGMGGQGGGFGQTLAAARGLGSSAGNILGLGGSAAGAAGTAATGYAGAGWASSVATGGYTGWAGSAAAGSAAAGGGLMSTVGAAMPWIGGAMLLDSLTGGKIIGGIAKGLFGGSWETKDAGLNLGVGSGSILGNQWERQRKSGGWFSSSKNRTRTSALPGDLRSSLQEAYSAQEQSLAFTLEVLGQQASALNAYSSGLTRISTKGKSEAEVEAAVQEWLQNIVNRAARSVVDPSQYAMAGETTVETLNRLATALTGVNPLLEQLHDVTLDASLAGGAAASHLAQMAGGIEAFADRAQFYYANILTEEERHQRAMVSAARAMGAFTARTGEVVRSTEALRDLVDGIDLTTEAGRRLYNEAMNLAPALVEVEAGLERVRSQFDEMLADAESAISDAESQLRRAWQAFDTQSFGQRITLLEMLGDSEEALALQRERELAAIDPLLRETQRHIWALQDEAKAQQEAAEAATSYANAVAQLAGALSGIGQWVDTQRATGQSPGNNLTAAGDQFARQLALAESGDRNALQSITQYADQYLAAGRDMYASGSGFQRIESDVIAALEGLPEAMTDAEYIVEGFRDIVSKELAGEIERAILESQYTIDTLIDFAANTDQLPADLRTILGQQAHRLDSTLNYLLGTNELDNDLRTLALKASNNLVSTIDLIAGSDISASDRRLALESSNLFTSVIDLALGSDLTAQNRRLALRAGNTYSVITDLILGSDLSAADRTLALESGHTYATAVELALRKDIDSGSRTLALSGGNVYRSLIEYAVDKDVSAADRRLALEEGSRYTSTLDLILGRNLSADNRTLALEANNLYTSSVDLVLRKDISEQNRRLALRNGSTYRTLMDYALREDVTAADRTLALTGGNTYATVLDIALGEDITAADRTLALEHANDYVSTIDLILGGDITGEERRLALEDANRYRSTINLVLGADISGNDRVLALESGSVYKTLLDYRRRENISDADRRLALNSGNTYRSTIELALGKDGLTASDRTLALKSANSYASTIDLILGKNISAENRKLALEASNTLNATVNASLGKVNAAARSLGLKSANHIQTTIGAVIASDVTPNERKLALQNANRLTTTVNAVLASGVSDEELGLALNASNAISTTITASIANSVNANQRKLALGNANRIQTTIAASIAQGVDSNTRKMALGSANRIQTTVAGVLAAKMPDDVKTLALKQTNSLTTTLHAALADGTIDADERKLLDARSEQIVKTLLTGGNLSLSADERAVINAASGQKRLDLLADVAFSQADLDELGDISKNTGDTGKNTKTMEERAREQLSKLVELSQEMGRTTDQFVSLNSTMAGLTASINALGVAQQEIARIEKERAAREKAERERIERERRIATQQRELESRAADARSRGDEFYTAAQDTVLTKVGVSSNLSQRRVNDLTGVVQRFMGSDNIMSHAELERALDYIQGQSNNWSTRDRAFATRLARGARQESRYHELMGQSASLAGKSYGGSVDLSFLGAQQYLNTLSNTERAKLYLERYPDLTQAQARRYGKTYGPEWANYHYNRWGKSEGRMFAKGGAFTNSIVSSPTTFDMGLMGEAGPEAIMPLTRHGDGSLGVRAELPPLPPLLGGGDVVEVLRDLKREVAELRRENARLQKEGNSHAAASVQVQQVGFQRQIAEQRRGNEYLADGAAAARLEASR